MKKHNVVLIMILLLVCVGCSKKNESNAKIAKESESISRVDTSEEEENREPYLMWEDFSEDRAWVAMGKMTHIGCIDKTGELLFEYYDMNILTSFNNGYAHIKDDNDSTVYVIDVNGNVQSSYPEDSKREVIAYGDGYTVTKEHKEGFDQNEYTYQIYDYSGKILEEFTTEDELTGDNTYYCGQAVFLFGTSNFYFIKSGQWVECTTSIQVHFYENTAAVGVNYYDDEGVTKLKIIDLDGVISEIPIPEEISRNLRDDIVIKNGVCVLASTTEQKLSIYDLSQNSFTEMKLKPYYTDKINWDAFQFPLICESNKIVLPLIGDDGEAYRMVCDDQWNVILEPVKGYADNYSCQRLVVETTDDTIIYDENGDIVCSLKDKGYEKGDYQSMFTQKCPVPYADDAMKFVIVGSGEPVYLGKNGDKLFETINIKKTKNKTIENNKDN